MVKSCFNGFSDDIGYGAKQIIFPSRRILPLYAMFTGCGHSRETSGSYSWNGLERGTREFTIFQYTISGLGTLEYEGGIYEVRPGQAFLVHIPHMHRYFLPKTSDHWEFIYFNLNGREAMRIWRDIEKINGPLAQFGQNSKLLEKTGDACASALRNEIISPFQASMIAYELVMLICEELLPCAYEKKIPDSIGKVIEFCNRNIGKKISIDDMALVAGFSRFHFSRLFTASQGISPSAFLTDLRMKHALRLIQTEMLTVKEISEICGFSDAGYFCKIFRKTFDTSPEKFRKGKQCPPDK